MDPSWDMGDDGDVMIVMGILWWSDGNEWVIQWYNLADLFWLVSIYNLKIAAAELKPFKII